MTDSFIAFLERRGTRTTGASLAQLDALRSARADFPNELLDFLSIQDGEDMLLTFAKGARFHSAAGVLEALEMLRTMVEEDDTLPTCFIDFVPFMTTDVRTDVGVFTSSSSLKPGCVAELCYERGELIWWASSVGEFMTLLESAVHPNDGLGFQFPAEAMVAESIHDLPGWPKVTD